ncbi:hypothetical protein [Maricaulis sp.]|uniref:hypothetical protein n=1 Tax=Maricaulis sp. TaxID=1486257 RepID=UPI003A938E5B
MSDLSAFDALFETAALPLLYEQFGEVMDYVPPVGAGVEGVKVILTESEEPLDAGGYGGRGTIKAERIVASVMASVLTPVAGGRFTRGSGAVVRIDGAPRLVDGEWHFGLVEVTTG